MELVHDTPAAVPVVDVSGLQLPGLEALPRVGEDMVELGLLTSFLAAVEVSGLPSDYDVLELVAAWHRVTAASAAAELAAMAELGTRPEVFGPDDDPHGGRPTCGAGAGRHDEPHRVWGTRWPPGWRTAPEPPSGGHGRRWSCRCASRGCGGSCRRGGCRR